jgi:chorismate mutase
LFRYKTTHTIIGSQTNINMSQKQIDWPYFNENNLMMLAGPCSAEGPKQIDAVAQQLVAQQIPILRAGVWKPRTRPGSFEGMGAVALPWLQEAQEKYGLKTAVEVATPKHVEDALKHNVDILWIGARTAANPFATQDLADALKGVDVPILVKNPTNPDASLWLGAIERVEKAGVKRIGAVHRGVSQFKKTIFRNNPQWEMAFHLRLERPDMLMICDPSHIAGRADLVPLVAQTALELNFDGLMIESHPTPNVALSDPQQQLDLDQLAHLMNALQVKTQIVNGQQIPELIKLRENISEIDKNIIQLLGDRMRIIQEIAAIKKDKNISIYQEKRWQELLNQHAETGKMEGLNINFILKIFDSIHLESIDKQIGVVHSKKA